MVDRNERVESPLFTTLGTRTELIIEPTNWL
jgi:hypothetical protein